MNPIYENAVGDLLNRVHKLESQQADVVQIAQKLEDLRADIAELKATSRLERLEKRENDVLMREARVALLERRAAGSERLLVDIMECAQKHGLPPK